jgi:hypothetical protein
VSASWGVDDCRPSRVQTLVTVQGSLIAESLRVGAVLDDVALSVHKVSRADCGDERAGQPRNWTFIEFETPSKGAASLARALSDVLDPSSGWYCDFRSDDETFVVFAGREFRYPRGDPTGRASAAAYARSVGVPESQLDWPE